MSHKQKSEFTNNTQTIKRQAQYISMLEREIKKLRAELDDIEQSDDGKATQSIIKNHILPGAPKAKAQLDTIVETFKTQNYTLPPSYHDILNLAEAIRTIRSFGEEKVGGIKPYEPRCNWETWRKSNQTHDKLTHVKSTLNNELNELVSGREENHFITAIQDIVTHQGILTYIANSYLKQLHNTPCQLPDFNNDIRRELRESEIDTESFGDVNALVNWILQKAFEGAYSTCNKKSVETWHDSFLGIYESDAAQIESQLLEVNKNTIWGFKLTLAKALNSMSYSDFVAGTELNDTLLNKSLFGKTNPAGVDREAVHRFFHIAQHTPFSGMPSFDFKPREHDWEKDRIPF